jgi:hypothetical protein
MTSQVGHVGDSSRRAFVGAVPSSIHGRFESASGVPEMGFRQPRAWLLFALCLPALTGCGGEGLYPVSGKVVYKDGKPVTAGFVIFEPVSQKISARGEIRTDGSFQVSTRRENDGALEGEYKVLIRPPPLPEEGKARPAPIHPRFQNLDTTPFHFTVTRDRKKNHFTLEVE